MDTDTKELFRNLLHEIKKFYPNHSFKKIAEKSKVSQSRIVNAYYDKPFSAGIDDLQNLRKAYPLPEDGDTAITNPTYNDLYDLMKETNQQIEEGNKMLEAIYEVLKELKQDKELSSRLTAIIEKQVTDKKE